MNKIEKAVSYFNQGNNCAQAILKAYGTQYGIDEDLAFKIASSLGGGLARSGNTCGAVTGALLVIGLKYRNLDAEDQENKELTYETGKNFIEQFRSINGTIKCKELLNCDISTLEGREKANKDNLFEDLCPKFVKSAAEILQTILKMQ
ncbi:MAG: C-GCAxxG-C-C family protein [Candidatus Hodarchaeota archaeon]